MTTPGLLRLSLLLAVALAAGCPRSAAPNSTGPSSAPRTAPGETATSEFAPATGDVAPAPSDVAPVNTRSGVGTATPAARQLERDEMVRTQLGSSWDNREPVTDERVRAALRRVPRHLFVPAEWSHRAYDDIPLPIGHGQTISQPYIVGFMTELLRLEPGARVLEVGTGSGYQAAVLAEFTDQVYSVEIVEPLAVRARDTLGRVGCGTVKLRHADGYFGWPEAAPFDAIIVTCAAGHLPPPLWEQLAPGGRIVIPIGDPYSVQRLVVVSKTQDGKRTSETVLAVQFVPMTRAD